MEKKRFETVNFTSNCPKLAVSYVRILFVDSFVTNGYIQSKQYK